MWVQGMQKVVPCWFIYPCGCKACMWVQGLHIMMLWGEGMHNVMPHRLSLTRGSLQG